MSTLFNTLSRDGYAILRNALDPWDTAKIVDETEQVFADCPFSDGPFFGYHTKRFGRMLTRAPSSANLVLHPAVLNTVESVLLPNCDKIQLNMTQAIQIWPGEHDQVPHRDEETWDGLPLGKVEYLVNVMWPISRFTPENGSTRLWRGSHHKSAAGCAQKAVCETLEPGDALLFLGSTLHCGGANRSTDLRTGIIVSYTLGWLRTYENQSLSYPPDVARSFPPRLAELAGYTRNRPNLGNVDLRCPSELLNRQRPNMKPASEALKPEQTEAIDTYYNQGRIAA